jgi:hypothetical protein
MSRYRPYTGGKGRGSWWAEWGLFLLVAALAACLLLALAYPVLTSPDALPAFKASHPPDPAQKAPESAVLDRVGEIEAAPQASAARAPGQP